MDVLQALETRRAIRAYTPEPVDRGTVEGLLRAATLAPSALNAQPWVFVVVQEPARLASCAARAKAHLLARPPGWMPDRLREKLEDPAYDLLHRAPADERPCGTAPLRVNSHDALTRFAIAQISMCELGRRARPVARRRPAESHPQRRAPG